MLRIRQRPLPCRRGRARSSMSNSLRAWFWTMRIHEGRAAGQTAGPEKLFPTAFAVQQDPHHVLYMNEPSTMVPPVPR